MQSNGIGVYVFDTDRLMFSTVIIHAVYAVIEGVIAGYIAKCLAKENCEECNEFLSPGKVPINISFKNLDQDEDKHLIQAKEEFINAIRGIEQITMATFETGVQYMEWTEAVSRSAESGQDVDLPLA